MCGDETSNHGQIRANRSKAGLKERWWNRDQGRRPPPSLRGDCPRRRAELDDHLGYVKGDPAGNGSGNSRNGGYDKTVTTAAGPVRIGVPRDRNGSFDLAACLGVAEQWAQGGEGLASQASGQGLCGCDDVGGGDLTQVAEMAGPFQQ